MQIELRSELINRLLGLPETGMGYQIVDLILTDGRIVANVKVFNCEIADLPDTFRNLRASDIADVRLKQASS
jgi:hypothetical protein